MRRNITRAGVARKQRHQRYQIRNWVNCLTDMPAFIVGNGPSVNDEDISIIEPYFSIGVNRSFYILDTTILLWQDISLWNTEYHKLHNTQALKVARDIADPKRIYYNFYLKGGSYRFDTSKTHILYGRGSSGPLAVQLAVSMGCRPIVLLGLDCNLGHDNRTDFYGNNKHWLPHTLDNCKLGLQFLKEQCPVEIINCSNNNLWPRQSLKNVVKSLNSSYAKGRQTYVKMILKT